MTIYSIQWKIGDWVGSWWKPYLSPLRGPPLLEVPPLCPPPPKVFFSLPRLFEQEADDHPNPVDVSCIYIANCKKIYLKELSNVPSLTRLAGCLLRGQDWSHAWGFLLSCPKAFFAFFPLSNLHSHPIPPLEIPTGRAAEVVCSPIVVERMLPCPQPSVDTYLSGLSF